MALTLDELIEYFDDHADLSDHAAEWDDLKARIEWLVHALRTIAHEMASTDPAIAAQHCQEVAEDALLHAHAE